MLLKIFLMFVTCFSANAMDFELYYLFPVGSPVGSPTKRKTGGKLVNPQPQVDYMNIEAGTQSVAVYTPTIIWGPYGEVIGVYEDSLRSQENISELEELQKSLKISKMLYKSHAIANTFLLGGAFYKSSDLLGISALYFCWCGAVYGVSSVETKRNLESKGADEQDLLKSLSSFQRNQACINLVAGACFFAAHFANLPELGYTLGGVALVAAVGNSIFYGCTN